MLISAYTQTDLSILTAIQTISSTPLSTLTSSKADRLLDGVHVVGDAAHHDAGFVFGVVAERKLVQVLENLHAQVAQHMLRRPGHQVERQAGHHRAGHAQADDNQHQLAQARDVVCGGGGLAVELGRTSSCCWRSGV